MPPASRPSVAEQLFRRLLVAAPPDFRRAYGEEMVRVFGRRCARARQHGRAAAARAVAAGLMDLLIQAVRGRADARRRARQIRGDAMLTLLAHDVRLALRTLRRAPGFTLAVVLTLATGIGATTVALALIEGAVLRPVPYPEPGRLVSVVQMDARYGPQPLAPPYLRDLRDRTSSFDTIAGFSPSWQMVLGGADERGVRAAFVSDGALELLGATPLSGRLFTAAEHASGAPVALVSQAFWDRQFGAGTSFAAQSISLDEDRVSIVGILPASLKMPITASVVTRDPQSAEVWLPFSRNPYAGLRNVPVMNLIARVKLGVTPAQATAQMAAVTASLASDYREMPREAVLRVVSLGDLVSRGVRSPLLLLLGAVACLLLIGCVNVANLTLVRAASRAGELALRVSLGATRGRLIRQLGVEACLLTAAATAVGVALAVWALAALPSLVVQALPPSATLRLDGRVMAVTIAIALVAALTAGVVPALRMANRMPSGALRAGGRTTNDTGTQRLRRTLVAIEVALALVLLVGAGLLARSFWAVTRVDPGFDLADLSATSLDLGGDAFAAPDAKRAFVTLAEERLAALPGVQSASLVNRLPLSGGNTLVGVEIEGQPPATGPQDTMDRRVVTPGYFTTMGIDLRDGRGFGVEDQPGSPDPVAVVNEAAARRVQVGAVVGHRVRLMLRGGPGPWLRVVGVVADVRHHGLEAPVQPEIYVPYSQAAVESFSFVVRSTMPAATVNDAVRSALKQVDPRVHVLFDAQTSLAALADASLAPRRLQALFVNGFAGVALLLAAIGIYGVVSYTVSRSARDIGVRLALGAQRGDVLRLIVFQHMRPVAIGAGLGLAGAFAASRALRTLLFGTTPTDVVTYVAVVAVLMAVGLAAAYLPARRAAGVDPVRALRLE